MKNLHPALGWLFGIFMTLAFIGTACGSNVSDPYNESDVSDTPEENSGNNYINTKTVTLNDGRVVECVTFVYGDGDIWCAP